MFLLKAGIDNVQFLLHKFIAFGTTQAGPVDCFHGTVKDQAKLILVFFQNFICPAQFLYNSIYFKLYPV